MTPEPLDGIAGISFTTGLDDIVFTTDQLNQFRKWQGNVPDGKLVSYRTVRTDGAPGFETGRGIYTAGTLTRATVKTSLTGNTIKHSWDAGEKITFLVVDSESLEGVLEASKNLSDLADTAEARENLELQIGVDVQAHSAVLDATNASYTTTKDAKLAGIEAGATADQTGAEIKALYEAEANTNAFTDAQVTKLAGIEAGATADQTGAEIKALYEAEADTNAFTDAQVTKLAGIESGATADQTDAEIEAAYNAQVSVVSQAEAEAGTSSTVRRWTAERIKQAIQKIATSLTAVVNDSGGPLTAFLYNTSTTLANASSRLAEWRNNAVMKAFIDKDGWFVGGPFSRIFFGSDFLVINNNVVFGAGASFGLSGDLQMGYDSGTNTAYVFSTLGATRITKFGGGQHVFVFGQHPLGPVLVSGDHSGAGATGTSQAGGALVVQGGDGAVNGDGGDVLVKGGAKAGTGIPGVVVLQDIPASAAGLSAGQVWNSNGLLTTLSGGVALAANENYIINGAFMVNQRGAVTKAQSVGVYGYDRWKGHASGLEQVVEYFGPAQSMTLSWIGGGTGSINGTSGASPLTVAVPAATNISVVVPDTSDRVKLEDGSVATVFVYPFIGSEIEKCQRYYYRIQGDAGVRFADGAATTTTSGAFIIWKTMRITDPAVNISNVQARVGASGYAISAISSTNLLTQGFVQINTTHAATANANVVLQLRSTASGGYIELDAEF